MKYRILHQLKLILPVLGILVVLLTGRLLIDPKPAVSQAVSPSNVAQTMPAPSVTTACTPFPGQLAPAPVSLESQPSGLTQVVDPLVTYQIYGDTPTAIRQQILACAPKDPGVTQAEFAAETSYRLSWQYNFKLSQNDLCVLTDVKVGVHVGTVVPQWQPTADARPDLATAWQTFIANLKRHEQGHSDLDVHYAQTLLDTLQALPASDCQTIAAQTSRSIQATVNALDQANSQYDATTNHGATQGAILP